MENIQRITGKLRAHTFACALELARANRSQCFVETGCYRGIPADGQSTLLFAMLAAELGGRLHSIDISQEHIDRAVALLPEELRSLVTFHCDDSLRVLGKLPENVVDLAYFDSYDYLPDNPQPAQIHQVAEFGAVYHKLSEKAIIICDDWMPSKGGGKPWLLYPLLKERGWNMVASGYQLVFVNYAF